MHLHHKSLAFFVMSLFLVGAMTETKDNNPCTTAFLRENLSTICQPFKVFPLNPCHQIVEQVLLVFDKVCIKAKQSSTTTTTTTNSTTSTTTPKG